MSKAKRGDILSFGGRLYSHYGVSTGDGQTVIHFTLNGPCKIVILKQPYWVAALHRKIEISNDWDGLLVAADPQTIYQRATDKIGSGGYNLLFNNCEHFATWCRYNVPISDQVTRLFSFLPRGLARRLLAYGDKREVTPAERADDKIGNAGYNLLFNNCEHFATWCRYNVPMSDQVTRVISFLPLGLARRLLAYEEEREVTPAERADNKIGNAGYILVFNNCEHFATWCRYNVPMSDQVTPVLGWMPCGLARQTHLLAYEEEGEVTPAGPHQPSESSRRMGGRPWRRPA